MFTTLELPPARQVQQRVQALAAIDTVMSPLWDERYFSFDACWDPAAGEQLGSMRNGQGDAWQILFTKHGLAILAATRAEVARAMRARRLEALAGSVPLEVREVFGSFFGEPAFEVGLASLIAWTSQDVEQGWSVVAFEDSWPREVAPGGLLEPLLWSPSACAAWVHDYWEVGISKDVVSEILSLHPMDKGLLARAMSRRPFEDVCAELRSIGYPIA